MNERRYEYVVVKLTETGYKDGEQRTTETVNRVSLHGWRLVTVTAEVGKVLAYFERPVGSP